MPFISAETPNDGGQKNVRIQGLEVDGMPGLVRDLCSQPTLSRLENAPALRDVIRLTYALVDQWMASYDEPPSSVTLDIDDTCDINSLLTEKLVSWKGLNPK